MHSSTARKAQSAYTQHARSRDDLEGDRADSTTSGINSSTTPGFGDPLSTLLEAGASLVGALRTVPAALQRKLSMIIDGMPELETRLDAKTVRPSRWGGRHESAFRSRAFAELKESIRQHKGNVQAILVIRLPDGGYEIVFWHRRHRACLDLGLPIKAVVWGGSVGDTELILIQDAENRCRTNPSVLDQGRMYAALTGKGGKEKVFESERALARAFGISHTWVRKAMSVAELPDQIMAAFEDPARIQPDHAQKIAKALKSFEGKAVLRRAAALTAQESPRTAAQVLDCLLGQGKGADAGQLKHGQQLLGSWKRDGKGRVVITLERTFSSPEVLCKVAALLGSLSVSDGVET